MRCSRDLCPSNREGETPTTRVLLVAHSALNAFVQPAFSPSQPTTLNDQHQPKRHARQLPQTSRLPLTSAHAYTHTPTTHKTNHHKRGGREHNYLAEDIDRRVAACTACGSAVSGGCHCASHDQQGKGKAHQNEHSRTGPRPSSAVCAFGRPRVARCFSAGHRHAA